MVSLLETCWDIIWILILRYCWDIILILIGNIYGNIIW
jgi:hypothetical protein